MYLSAAGEIMRMEKHASYSLSSYSWEVLRGVLDTINTS